MKRKVAIFTGNRAEYGLQFPILKAIAAHPDLDYKLIVSGAHLDAFFGNTLSEISKDGFKVTAEVQIKMEQDNLYATSMAIGSGVIGVTKALAEIKPDLMVVYADRFESFAAIIASTQMNIPTAHIEGGDITEGGALDDSVRHAMTKLSHLHFTTNQQATDRVLAMGEEPWRVHTVGFPAIDLIEEGIFTKPDDLYRKYSLDKNRPIILFTQHSVTTEFEKAADQIKPSLESLDRLAAEGCQVIITYPNNDAGGKMIIETINNYKFKKPENVQVHISLGRINYHGILNLSREGVSVICVGNSSSGIKETPVFFCPTVNIGSRQDGRLRSENVLDAAYDSSDIYNKIQICLKDEKFKKTCMICSNPYGTGGAGKKIAEFLCKVELNPKLVQKKMTI